MIGSVPSGKAVCRSGAKPGDFIYVSGSIGGSMLGLERLKAGKRKDPAATRHLYPSPRIRLGGTSRDQVHGMVDISDELSTALAHVLEESKVTARIYKD